MSAFITAAPILSSRTRLPGRDRSVSRLSRRLHVRVPRATADLPTPADGAVLEQPPSDRSSGPNCRIKLDGKLLAYDYYPGEGPTVLFIPGYYNSRYKQSKANALEIFAKRKGQGVLVEDYLGIGRSEGDFVKEGTLSRWIRDTIGMIDEVLDDDEKVVLVGSGIGGWIMLHVAMRLPHRVVGVVGVNVSVDFTEDLVVPKMTEEQLAEMDKSGMVNMEWGYTSYPIGKALVDDAKKWLILPGEKGGFPVTCPVRLLQGMKDEEVPPERVVKLAERLQSEEVVVQFVKYADHAMDEEEDLKRLWDSVCELTDSYYEYDLTSPSSG